MEMIDKDKSVCYNNVYCVYCTDCVSRIEKQMKSYTKKLDKAVETYLENE